MVAPNNDINKNIKVAVAMSGGVDSSVAAALFCAQGYQVIGVTLKLQHTNKNTPDHSTITGCASDANTRAKSVAEQLRIKHYIVDGSSEFEQLVLRPSWNEYKKGRTPSPCLICNEHIKFSMLLKWANAMGATKLATGHYVRIIKNIEDTFQLLRGRDSIKDQSYFLAGLNQYQLGSVLFPLGEFTKTEVRAMAHKLNLATSTTKESQDACLVGSDVSFAEKLREFFAGENIGGPIIDTNGIKLGEHTGIHKFTIGQRKGLGVASLTRRWVCAINPADAAVIITDDEAKLNGDYLRAHDVNWVSGYAPRDELDCQVQIRYNHKPAPAIVTTNTDNSVEVRFKQKVRAITPGQAAVFYDGERTLGRGWISV
ncbi:MAG: tRNA 2-thiouridine(34) synthase MnmA [Deltaproteobacteria bacterium]|nr:tRNA 2-thiouridine(34) synthase MnmA [Deltaproteobacteria bacterium]